MKKLVAITLVIFLLCIGSILPFFSTRHLTTSTLDTKQNHISAVAENTDWWPQYGHDAAHTGYSTSFAPATNNIFLTTYINGMSTTNVRSSGALVDGRLYIGFETGYLSCVNAYNGSVIWNTQVGEQGSITGTPAVSNGLIYLGVGNNLCCYSTATGQLLWNFTTGGTVKYSPCLVQNKIYVGSYDNKLYCLNSDGTELWNYTADNPIITAPTVANDRVYFTSGTPLTFGPSVVYCLFASNGTKKWQFNSYSSPATTCSVEDNKVYVGFKRDLYCLDAYGKGDGTTRILWSFYSPFECLFTSISLAYERAYFGTTLSGIDKFYCMNATTGKTLWNTSAAMALNDIPAIADEKVFFVNGNQVNCYTAFGNGQGNASLLWDQSVDWPHGQPLIADGRLWVLTGRQAVIGFGQNLSIQTPERPTGPTQGVINEEYSYQTNTIMSQRTISYFFDWGDGHNSGWIAIPSAKKTWATPGTYLVKTQVKDSSSVSSLSQPLSVTITESTLPSLHITITSSTIPEETDFTVVITASGTPRQGATITFLNEQKTTNADGKVTFTAPRVSQDTTYPIAATYPGYSPATTTIAILNIPTQIYGYLYGVVTDNIGTLLSDVKITVIANGVQIGQAISGSDGRYDVPTPAGTYTIISSKNGYKTNTVTNVVIQEKIAQQFNIVLESQQPPVTQSGEAGAVEYMIDEKTNQGFIGARMDVTSSQQPTISIYTQGLSLNVLSLKDKVSFTVSGSDSIGMTIVVVSLTEGSLSSLDDLTLTYDGQTLQEVTDLKEFFNFQTSSQDPSWMQISTKTGTYALVKIPKFSTHTIVISPLMEAVIGVTLIALYSSCSIIAVLILISPRFRDYLRIKMILRKNR
jgi:outer membrane protein assembly factor BamB